MRGRAREVGAAATLAAAGALLLAAPATAEPQALTVNPAHGPATAPVHATYTLPGFQQRCPALATFAWDNQRVGTAKFVTTPRACIATLSFPPPAIDRAPGSHVVSARAGITGLAALAGYVIDLAGSPSATPSRSVKPNPTPTPTRTRAAPSPTLPIEDTSTAPAASDTPAAAVSPETTISAAGSHTPWIPWAMVGGGALVLGGLAIIGIMLYQGRRAARGDGTDDAPTVEQPRLES